MHPVAGQSHTLPRRLRALREETWPKRPVTQSQLADAFGAEKSTSVPLISSWENASYPKIPPVLRLEAYARFFATERSIHGTACQLLKAGELSESEQVRYEQLLDELTALRSLAMSRPATYGATAPAEPKGLWEFPDTRDILIVCAPLPKEVGSALGSYSEPGSPDYVELYTYADPDALLEAHSHLRAMNANSNVVFRTADRLDRNDYSKHLVLLGGVDWNSLTKDVLRRVNLPLHQQDRPTTAESSCFEATDGDEPRIFTPVIQDGVLIEDVALFYRGRSPFNREATVTICNGMVGRGTYGAVRTLTDPKFRARNEEYVRNHLKERDAISLLMRVQIVNGDVLTPDWTDDETRLHQWPEATA